MRANGSVALSSGRRISGYRPWLDGVRAVAIVLVLCRHLGFGWASHAGGPGVALFFGLSGYLITGLLLDERRRRGAVDLAAFYIRRAARLLPAVLVMLVVSDLWFELHGRRGVVAESLSVLLYVKNYRDIAAGGHGLFGQCWSLAVEEHFYLLWPVPLLLMARRWRARRIVVVICVLAALALAWRIVLVGTIGTGRAPYVETLARSDSLLLGCALAVAVRAGLRIPRWVTAVAVVVFAWIASPFGHPAVVEQTVGYTLQSVVCALVVAGLDAADSRARRLLSVRPIVEIGVLSYGIYLWHISVLVALPRDLGAARGVVAVAATLVLATTSYWLVERPVRRWARSAHDRWRDRSARVVPLPADSLTRAMVAPVVPARSRAPAEDEALRPAG
jgi:peptidoglycan/LPS O-acetylase OafA/YrhL